MFLLMQSVLIFSHMVVMFPQWPWVLELDSLSVELQ